MTKHIHKTSLDWWGAWVITIISTLWLSQSALIGLHWHDTSEFIGAGRALAVAHPPGHPLTLISIHLSQLTPWLDATARGHLTSVYWGALGSATMYLNAQLILVSSSMNRWTLRLISALVALSSVALPMVWLQLIRAEVYGPQWALTCMSWTGLFYATYHRDNRGYLVTAFALGLLAANHTLLTVALVIGLLPRLITLRLSRRVWLLSILTSLIGLSLYLYVWARGTHGGVVGWGWINSIDRLWEHISAQVWQTQVSQRVEEVSWLDNSVRFSVFIARQLGWVISGLGLIVVTLAGVQRCSQYYKSRRDRTDSSKRRSKLETELDSDQKREREELREVNWGVTLAWTTLCVALTKLTYPFSEQNPDFSGYIAASAPSLLLMLGRGARLIHPRLSLLIFASLFAGAVTTHDRDSGARAPESRGAEAWGRLITAEVPTEGTLWSSFYATHFITSALWAIEGWRSDITLAFRGHRSLEWAHRRSATPQLELNMLGARYEPERSIDAAPELWSIRSAPGGQAHLTSKLLQSSATAQELNVSDDSLVKLRERWLTIADARVSSSVDLTLRGDAICDEDSAYTWALYHEVALRSIYERLTAKLKELQELRDLQGPQIPQNLRIDTQGQALSAEIYALRRGMKSHLDAKAWWIDVISDERWTHVNDLH